MKKNKVPRETKKQIKELENKIEDLIECSDNKKFFYYLGEICSIYTIQALQHELNMLKINLITQKQKQ